MVARPSRVLNRHRGFQNIGQPSPVFTVENSANNNSVHPTHSKSVHATCMVSNPTLQNKGLPGLTTANIETKRLIYGN